MAPLVVLVGLFVGFFAVGLAGVSFFAGWVTPLRFALAGMFLLTASAHWGRRRPDLIRMVPPAFPRPGLLVTLTGLLEFLGAVGLLIPGLAPYAALGLSLLLLALFPANVHAARARLAIGTRPVMALLPRALVQILFLLATLAVFVAPRQGVS
ncbi:MAG: hypothetical protein ABI895_42020 [Deltaproteobacteria bacterium]